MYDSKTYASFFHVQQKHYLNVQNEADQNCIEHNIGKEPNNDINIKNKGGGGGAFYSFKVP